MTKEQFLQALRKRLSDLSRGDREERLTFYCEMIEDRMEEGLTEVEAVAAVGSADEIAGQILAESTSKTPKEGKTGRIVLWIAGSPVWISLLATVFAIWISLWAGVASAWAGFASLVGGAVGGIAGGAVFAIVKAVPGGVLLVGCGLACIGLAIFTFFGCKAVSKAMVWLTRKMVKWCKACFGKKEEAL